MRTRQIEEQRRFTERIIDSLPVGLYVIDREYRISRLEPQARDGHAGRVARRGDRPHDLRDPAPAARGRCCAASSTTSSPPARSQQFQMESSATGELRTYRISKIPMRLDDGPVTHVITIGEDITEWREAQDRIRPGREARRDRAARRRASCTRSTIRSRRSRACAESLSLAPRRPAAPTPTLRQGFSDYLRIIDSEVHRCKRIIDGLLDFSRPKAGDKTPVDVNAVIERDAVPPEAPRALQEAERRARARPGAHGRGRTATGSSWCRSSWRCCSTRWTRWTSAARSLCARVVGARASEPVVAEVVEKGTASARPSCRRSSSRSTRRSRRAAARASGCPSATGSSPSTAAASRWTARRARAATSASLLRADEREEDGDGMIRDESQHQGARSPRTRRTSGTILENFLTGRGYQVTTAAGRARRARGAARRGVRRRAARHRDARARRARGAAAGARGAVRPRSSSSPATARSRRPSAR